MKDAKIHSFEQKFFSQRKEPMMIMGEFTHKLLMDLSQKTINQLIDERTNLKENRQGAVCQ